MISAKKSNFIVELRPNRMRLARLDASSPPLSIEGISEFKLTPDNQSEIVDRIRAMADAKGNGYMNAVCSVFPPDRLIRQLQLDCGKGKETDFVIDYLNSHGGIDLNAFSIVCLSAENGKDGELSAFNKKSVLICGASNQAIQSEQEALTERAVYPTRLEIGTLGLIGAIKDVLLWQQSSTPSLVLEIDAEDANAIIVGPNGVEMARRIACGVNDLAEALKEEMRLKDIDAAKKLLSSTDFDLGPMAPKILRKLLRELQSSIGFFEVQTGQSISSLFCLVDGQEVGWMKDSIRDLLNLTELSVDVPSWLKSQDISLGESVDHSRFDTTWLSLLALVCEYEQRGAEE